MSVTADQILGAIQIARVLIDLGMAVGDGIKKLFGETLLTEDQINAIEAAAANDDDVRAARRIAEMNP